MTEDQKLLNYHKNIICGAKNGNEDDFQMLRVILLNIVQTCPPAVVIELSEHIHHFGVEEYKRLNPCT